jgi:diadenosine tetraphosphate (Ap4A) HIT family hydrolase/predicted kinase
MEQCNLCDADLGPIIAESTCWRLVLNRNQNCLGKCFLVLRRHLEAVPQLSPAEWTDLHDQLAQATHVLTLALQPDHFNYAFLQNQDRHIHLHIIPRYSAPRVFGGVTFDDPDYPGHYAVPAPARHLTQNQFTALAEELRNAFKVPGRTQALSLARSSGESRSNRIPWPQLIVVTGRPAAGKTTLARWLAQQLRIPIISKDGIREVLFEQLGWKDRAWAQMLGRATIDLMFYFAEMQLEAGRSLILDNAFDPSLSAPRFRALTARYGARMIQVICNSDQETLLKRFKARADLGGRHPGHGDEDVLDQLRSHLAQNHSPRMELDGPVIEVNTTDFSQVDYHSVLHQVQSLIEEG